VNSTVVAQQKECRPIAAQRPRAAGKKDAYVPFLVRFQAWWQGVEPGALMRRRQQSKPQRANRIDVGNFRERGERWTKRRLEIIARIYGEGFIHAGGLEYAQRLLEPQGLDESMSVLDMSAGLGGSARYIANEFGSWVTGMETEKPLADIGMRLSRQERLKDKAPIKLYDPEHVEILDRRYHFILMRERLYTVKNKTRLLTQMADALAPGGKIMLVEFVVADKDAKDAELIKNWCKAEYETPVLFTEDEMKDCIYRLKLELKSYTDESEPYRKAVLADWAKFTKGLQKEELDQEFVDIMMDEAELNKSRTEAMNSGLLKPVRIELERRRTEILLSNW